MDISIIQHQLQDFNLSEEETSIYIQLLKLGEASISTLAHLSKLKRSSSYNYVQKLIDIHLAEWKPGTKKKIVQVLDPINLHYQIYSLKEKYLALQETYQLLLPELNALKTRKNFSTQVKYYEGIEGLQKMVLNTLQANQNLYGYSYYGRNDVLGKAFMKSFREQWVKSRLKDHVIVNNSSINKKYPDEVMVKEYLKYQEARFIPKEKFYISSDIMIYNNVYAVANLDSNNPIGVEIINEEIVKTQMSIFNILWEQAKPISWL